MCIFFNNINKLKISISTFLLCCFFTVSSYGSNQCGLFLSNTKVTSKSVIDRRSFFKVLGGAGAMIATSGLVFESSQINKTYWDKEKNQLVVSKESLDHVESLIKQASYVGSGVAFNTVVAKVADYISESTKDHPKMNFLEGEYSRTAMEAHMLLIGEIIFSVLSPVPNGNTGASKLSKISPAALTFNISILAPVIEEVLFRLIPHEVFGESWTVGVVSSAIFAGAHNIGDFSKIPITQFVGGVYYWYLMRERGVDHSILAHSFHNNSIAFGMNLSRIY